MRRLVLSVLLVLLMAPLTTAARERPDPPEVFTPPPADELSSIEHAELRKELLWMAFEDQEARKRGG